MKTRYVRISFLTALFFLLLIDLNPAVDGIRVGIDMCLQTVIPSLLPFLILTKSITSQLYGLRVPILAKIGEWCGIPRAMESILAVGLMGGYPMGAHMIADAWQNSVLNKDSAERMLGFCNNAGPAFIFGVCAALFTKAKTGWLILLIQVLTSLWCGCILPGKNTEIGGSLGRKSASFVESVKAAVSSMGYICGWILCFRVVLSYIEAYFHINNPMLRAGIFGILELSNGCIALNEIPSEFIRFILANAILSFGGLCVWLQTASVGKELSLKWFCIGKITQSLLSIFFSVMIGQFIYDMQGVMLFAGSILGVLVITWMFAGKKTVAFSRTIIYNKIKTGKKRYQHAVSQKN